MGKGSSPAFSILPLTPTFKNLALLLSYRE